MFHSQIISWNLLLYDWGNLIFLWNLLSLSLVLCQNCFLYSTYISPHVTPPNPPSPPPVSLHDTILILDIPKLFVLVFQVFSSLFSCGQFIGFFLGSKICIEWSSLQFLTPNRFLMWSQLPSSDSARLHDAKNLETLIEVANSHL